MNEYLAYLDKLNSLVDSNELERAKDDCQRQKLQVRKWGRLSSVFILLAIGLCIPAFAGLGELLRSVLYGEKYHGVEGALWLALYIIVIAFTLWLIMTYIDSKYKLDSMLGISYVENSYAVVRNTIIDEGEEFMRKLFIQERLYTLTVDDKRKYDYVLKVIRTLRLECERFENKGV